MRVIQVDMYTMRAGKKSVGMTKQKHLLTSLIEPEVDVKFEPT